MNSKELDWGFQAERGIQGDPTCEELGSHVDGGAHDAARHHRLGFAEPQIRDFGPILFVQLGEKATGRWELHFSHKILIFGIVLVLQIKNIILILFFFLREAIKKIPFIPKIKNYFKNKKNYF